MITHAAVKIVKVRDPNRLHDYYLVSTRIYLGKRHGVIMQRIWKELGEIKIEQDMQGFVDEKGTFYSREEAAAHALAAKQITKIPKRTFMSEDLW